MKGLMNGEYALYKLIKDNKNFSGTDIEIAKMLNKSPSSVTKYRYKLKDAGYIEYKIAWKDNKMRTFYKLTDKEYTGDIEW